MALPSKAGQMPEDMPVEGLHAEDSPRPTLLTSRLADLCQKDEGMPAVQAPKPQVFGAALQHNCTEEGPVESNSEGIPCNRKEPEELVKEEAFWTKAQEALEERARREQLLQFLRKHRFKDVNTSSGWFFNFRFPLHAAVEDNDAEMVRVLLHFKSRTKMKETWPLCFLLSSLLDVPCLNDLGFRVVGSCFNQDAAGLSARQLARKRNHNGSHDMILQILNEHAAARRKRAAARRATRSKTKTDGLVVDEGEPPADGTEGQPDEAVPSLLSVHSSLDYLPARPWHDSHVVGMPRALVAVLLLVSGGAQRLKEYNLWVCPHCERGVKVADVTDLSCEVSSTVAPSGHEWPWVKKAMRNFLRSFHLPPEKRAQQEVDELIKLASAPLQGECYLGIVALGFFVFHFMDPVERQNLIRTSVFGGVTFQKAVPLSYWDVYASGWPIFGLLATAAETVQHDLQTSGAPASQPDLGMTGIDLGPRDCCDFPGGSAAVEDQRFLLALGQSLQGTAWLASDRTSPALPLRTSLEYLTAYRRCSWGRAAAYFAAAESLLVTSSQLSQSVWNSTKALVALGEHNLDGCASNMTVYHQMQSVWPFWQILGRLEARALSVEAPAISSSPSLLPPPALPEAVGLKWQRLLGSRGLKVDEQPLPKKQEATLACLSDSDGFAHVALSADLAQIDGLIVTLQSAVTSAANASSLCFHAFVLPQQKDFVIEGLRCAFAETLVEDGAGRGLSWPILGTFRLHDRAQLILHGLDSDHIWAEVGMNSTGVRGNHSASAIMLGETDLSNSLRSDTGNLGAVHNFARFSLHTLLPGLSRVVYLDVDVVVKGDLAELYNVTMSTVNGAPGTVAAVQRSNQPLRTYVDVLQPAVPSWLPSEAPSFNAGVMVIDLARWRQRHASRLVAEWIEMNSRRRLWLHGSQPPLLLLFHDEVVSLHWSWNVDGLGHRLNYPKHVLAEAKVLHWTGPLKPWRHHGVNRKLWEPHTREYCPKYSNREHTTTCRPDSWFC
eukprot:s3174_g5.t1